MLDSIAKWATEIDFAWDWDWRFSRTGSFFSFYIPQQYFNTINIGYYSLLASMEMTYFQKTVPYHEERREQIAGLEWRNVEQ